MGHEALVVVIFRYYIILVFTFIININDCKLFVINKNDAKFNIIRKDKVYTQKFSNGNPEYEKFTDEPKKENTTTIVDDSIVNNGGLSRSWPSDNIPENDFCNEFSKSFMQYALSIILGRALPDVRDGLKIVHRRILWAMNELNLTSNSPFRKSAKVVGDVLGKYHPHSDKSVYDALCRLSQSFVQRIPLIQGHGNFGTIDDPPAAMRYTECRLSSECNIYMSNIENDTIDLIPNFDSSEIEPTVLPSKLPMLLINGTSGIAVGLAANIPCHNPVEILNAAIHIAGNRGNSTLDELLSIVKGPDFPSGGVINSSKEVLKSVYETGKGSIQISAAVSFEEHFKDSDEDLLVVNHSHQLHFSPGSRISIVIKQLPIGVHLTEVTTSLVKGIQDGVLTGISNIRDETDRNGLRLCLDLKKQVSTSQEVEHIMDVIYKISKLKTFYKCNFVALVQRNQSLVPVRLSLLSALRYWLEFRIETIKRRTNFFVKKLLYRKNIIEGMIKVVNNAEKVVRMIQKSSKTSEIVEALSSEEFGSLNKNQISAVMKLTLIQLTKLHSRSLDEENEKLTVELDKLNKITKNPDIIYDIIVEELEALSKFNKELFIGKNRKTIIKGEESMSKFIYQPYQEKSLVTLNLHTGVMHKFKLPTSVAKPRKLNLPNASSQERILYQCIDIDQRIIIITTSGLGYIIPLSKLNFSSKGITLSKLIPGLNSDVLETIASISPYSEDKDSNLYIINQKGWLRVVSNKELLKSQEKNGIRRVRLFRGKPEEESSFCVQSRYYPDSFILVSTKDGFLIKISLESLHNVKKMTKLINLLENDRVVSSCIVPKGMPIFLISSAYSFKSISVDDIRVQSKGGRGINTHALGGGKLLAMQPILHSSNDLLIISDNCIFKKKIPLKNKLPKHKPSRMRNLSKTNISLDYAKLV